MCYCAEHNGTNECFCCFCFFQKKISSWGGQESTTFQTPSLTKGKFLDGPHWSLWKGRVDERKSNAGFMSWEPGAWPSGVLLHGNYTSFDSFCVVSIYFMDSYLKSFWLIGGWEPALLSNWTRFLCSLQDTRTSRNMKSSLCSFSADVMLLRSFLLWILGGLANSKAGMWLTEPCSAPCSPAEVLRAHCQPRSNLPSEANGRLWSQGLLSARTSTSTASNFPDIRRDPTELPCPMHIH